MSFDRQEAVRRRHLRVRRKVWGTADSPRLCLHRSARHLYAQLVDDDAQRTLLQVTTNRKSIKTELNRKSYCTIESAQRLGTEIGKLAVEAGIRRVVFDRGGNRYHGCVKTFADAAREAGLKF